MSRRHKETDRIISQPKPVEPVADCRPQTTDESTVQVHEGLKDALRLFEQSQVPVFRKKLVDQLSRAFEETIEDALRRALADYTYPIQVKLVDGYGNEKPCQTLPELELYLRPVLKRVRALQKDVLLRALEEDNSPPDEEDEPRGRGRPVIKRLCGLFRDERIWPLAKDIFRKIYHESIQKAVNLTQYLVCFVCSLFHISKTEVIDGRVAHFHRLMKDHFHKRMMPSLRKLQQGVQWLRDKTKTFFRNKKAEKEELLHQAWEALVQLISGHMVELAPLYAN